MNFCNTQSDADKNENVDQVVAELEDFMQQYGVTDLVTWGIPPGVTAEEMNGSLEKFVRDVVPRLKSANS